MSAVPDVADLRTAGRARARRLLSTADGTQVIQDLKAVAAAVAAWVLAASVLDLHHAFLAPWVALLTVHATVHRSLRRGAETVLAVALGLLLSFITVQLVLVPTWSLALALLVGLSLARLPPLRNEGVTVATTAIFVIAAGDAASEPRALDVLPDRLLATAIGVVVALVVNVLVVPPLDDRTTQRWIDEVDRRLGHLLGAVAQGLERRWTTEDADGWIEDSRVIDGHIEHAWSLVRYSRESRRHNLRSRHDTGATLTAFADVLERLEEGVAQARGIARHLREADEGLVAWDPRFRERFVPLLAELGRRVAEPEADVADLREDIGNLIDDLSTGQFAGEDWPLHGALLAAVRTIIEVVDDVATARHVRS